MICLPTIIVATMILTTLGGATGAAWGLYLLAKLANTLKR